MPSKSFTLELPEPIRIALEEETERTNRSTLLKVSLGGMARALLAEALQGRGYPLGSKQDNAARRIFEHWRLKSGMLQTRLTDGRRRKIAARLKEGYSEEDICRAIDKVCENPWHRGDNPRGRPFLELEMILRSATKLEGYLYGQEPQGDRYPVLHFPTSNARV